MPYQIEFDGEPYDMEAIDDADAIRVARQFAGQLLQEAQQGLSSYEITLWGDSGQLLLRITVRTERFTGPGQIRRATG